ncbi:malonyl-CoA decarboxylase [Propylenella binzhouense]|uniref:MCD, Malonyl-CoA decarboxylase MCD n=1 Tax=Propylenella binzhouense TaxID=2555902 RepID=A0A964T7D3_9HYPH|nr:malonyl-CoA decarboxylase [Propylenella binzhouense]MYZ49779.1 MCD, Malonyl-CoA decarboxylase MCD [Propylenella binzhouense]
MSQTGFLQDLFSSIAERGRRLLETGGEPDGNTDLADLAESLYSSLGEASGVAIADRLLRAYEAREPARRLAFFKLLADRFGIDPEEAVAAAQAYRAEPTPEALERLHHAAEPRRQELIRRLNLAPGGTAKLVRMREDLLAALPDHPELRGVDMDFRHLFQSWFNRGFLEARRIDWQTPAAILDKIIRYEAVHEISDWDDLRRRIDPPDRRLYAFFHPRLVDEPLIFVEVALTVAIPATIASILAADREPTDPAEVRTAVFYSISNCQEGLRGVSFGNFLIKQVVEDLRREMPNLKTFVTLSPVPGFAAWLTAERKREGGLVDAEAAAILAGLDTEGWWTDEARARELEPVLMRLAACYLTRARNGAGKPLDPVARFHLGNGARLERINWLGDRGRDGLRRAHGLLVNYLYRLEEIERNHEAYANTGNVAASPAVMRLARSRPSREAQTVTA